MPSTRKPSWSRRFLEPTLLWRLFAAEGGAHEIELSYVTGGMRWEATYNAVAAESGDRFDVTGWVTLENMTGKDFDQARVKLMAGDVARIERRGEAWVEKETGAGFDPETGSFAAGSVQPLPGFDTFSYTWSSNNPDTHLAR
jgi:hypothetical protein